MIGLIFVFENVAADIGDEMNLFVERVDAGDDEEEISRFVIGGVSLDVNGFFNAEDDLTRLIIVGFTLRTFFALSNNVDFDREEFISSEFDVIDDELVLCASK